MAGVPPVELLIVDQVPDMLSVSPLSKSSSKTVWVIALLNSPPDAVNSAYCKLQPVAPIGVGVELMVTSLGSGSMLATIGILSDSQVPLYTET